MAQTIDLFSLAFVFGATAWFFFVQSPVLLKKMGREQFVIVQMRLTVVLFKTLIVALFIMVCASLIQSPYDSPVTISAMIAFAAGLINNYIVLPKALKAGGQGRIDIKGKDSEGSIAGFVSEGIGNKTEWLHRLVVLFVVMMLGGVAVHGIKQFVH